MAWSYPIRVEPKCEQTIFSRSNYQFWFATRDTLIRNVAQVNPRTIVVLYGGGGFDVQSWIDRVPALLHAWFPGQYGGQALAEILFGAVNA